MPSRIIREGINSSARINALSPGAEILYRRLMSVVDDYGRFYASPTAIRGACWPTTRTPPCEQDVSKWLTECLQIASNCSTAPITLYEVAGCRYLQITDFNQKIRSKSKFPTPVDTLPASCLQSVDNCGALGDVRLSDCEVRISSSNAEASSLPETAAAVRQYFPAADDAIVVTIAQSAARSYSDAVNGHGKSPPFTDALVAEAVHEAYFKKQTSPALFLQRVPRVVKTWAEESIRNGTIR